MLIQLILVSIHRHYNDIKIMINKDQFHEQIEVQGLVIPKV